MEIPDYRSKSNRFLVNILRNYTQYSDIEVKTAFEELKSRGILSKVIDQLRKERKEQISKNLYTSGLKPGVVIDLSRCKTFRIGSTQQIVFEQKLMIENIPYLRREGLDVIVPIVNYYFTREDFPRADELEIESEKYAQSLENKQKTKTPKKALSSFFWITLFFLFFIIFSLLWRWMSN